MTVESCDTFGSQIGEAAWYWTTHGACSGLILSINCNFQAQVSANYDVVCKVVHAVFLCMLSMLHPMKYIVAIITRPVKLLLHIICNQQHNLMKF